MARSSYVYVVLTKAAYAFVGAFTVKHEMESYLKRHPGIKVEVIRVRDGNPEAGWSKVEFHPEAQQESAAVS